MTLTTRRFEYGPIRGTDAYEVYDQLTEGRRAAAVVTTANVLFVERIVTGLNLTAPAAPSSPLEENEPGDRSPGPPTMADRQYTRWLTSRKKRPVW